MINELRTELNYTTTDNGAGAHNSTLSKCLDFFAIGGSLRGIDIDTAAIFKNAYYENKLNAIRLAFMFRDIRFGQGQRQPFRDQLNWLAFNESNIACKILKFVPEYGRWDDLYSVFETPCETIALQIIEDQVNSDVINIVYNKPISILGKWLKRINTSNYQSVEYAHKIRKHLNMTCKDYRKLCKKLNNYLEVPENLMSANQWDQINYEHIPSQCRLKYRRAFYNHDSDRYLQYLNDVSDGRADITTGTLYPYQLVEKVLTGSITDQEANVLWDNLTEIPFDENALVVADVSGSMSGMPINVCISLALYLSQNAKGIYKDSFITFSEKPELVELTGTTFTDKVKQLISAAWGMNTNLRMVFEKVLSAAINSHLSPAEMIKTLYIISDMQFDEGLSDTPDESLFGELKEMFNSHGYALPKLVYWNVAADHKFPVINNEPNTVMISGFSPNIIRYINEGILTPEQMMLDVINSERYSVIEI